MRLVTHDCVFGTLREFRLGFHVCCFKLSLKPSHFLHVAFRKFLETDLVRDCDRQLLFLVGERLPQLFDAALAFAVLLFQSFLFEVQFADLVCLLSVVLVRLGLGRVEAGSTHRLTVLTLDVFEKLVEARVLVLQINHLFAHLVGFLFLVLDVSLDPLVGL